MITWEKNLEEQEGSQCQQQTISKTKTMDGDTDDISIKGGKAEQKPNINRILKKYNVPWSTLQDHISGRVTHGTKPRP